MLKEILIQVSNEFGIDDIPLASFNSSARAEQMISVVK